MSVFSTHSLRSAGMRFGTSVPAQNFDPDKPYRFTVTLNRETFRAVQKGARAAGMSEGAYVQAFVILMIEGWSAPARAARPSPDDLKAAHLFATARQIGVMAAQVYFAIEAVADEGDLATFGFDSLARRFGWTRDQARNAAAELIEAGLIAAAGTAGNHERRWRVTGGRLG